MQIGSPSLPIDSLKQQQAGAFDEAGNNPKPDGKKQKGANARAKPGGGEWNLSCRQRTRHRPKCTLCALQDNQ
jgi:hypothetical protein